MKKPTSAQLFQLWRVSQGKIPNGKSRAVIMRNGLVEFKDVKFSDGLVGGEFVLTEAGLQALNTWGTP